MAAASWRRLSGLISLATLALVALLSSARAQPVSDSVLSRVQVTETDDCAVATIDFNFPIQVASSFPENHGDHVRINLRPIEVGRLNGGALTSREELRPPTSRKAGIQEIQYDGDAPTGPVLTVTFSRERYYAIDQGQNFRSVNLRIADSPAIEACSGKKPGLRTGPELSAESNRTEPTSILHSLPEALDVNAVYALNLLSQQEEIARSALPSAAPLSTYAAYAVRFEENGVVWNRLRLGFFKTRTDAQRVKEELAKLYPDAWIVRTSDQERESVYQAWIASRRAGTRSVALIPKSPPVESLPENRDARSLIEEARTLMTDGDYPRAIQILTKALMLEENAATPDARELLGLAREKNGQLARAKAEYEEYLQRYPDAEGAARVRQRLASLLAADGEAPPDLREGGDAIGKFVSRFTASLSQYYQRDESTVTLEQPELVPDPDKQVNRNALVSGADLTASISNDRFDSTLRFSGSHTQDFVTDGKGGSGAISAFFVEVADNVTRLAARFGRQTRSTGGVLGRFDGGLLSFDASDKVRVNVVGGAPVIRSRDLFIDDHRRFVGASVDVNQVLPGLDATVYFLRQNVDDLVDREAAGFELRYVDDHRSVYGLVDYDVFYDTLNLALFNGTWRLQDNTTFNVAFDYRYAPTLMTIDAFQGQSVETIDDLRTMFGYSDDEIYYLAESRTARTRSGSFNVSHPFSEKWQANFGVSVSSMSPTIDTPGVPGQPGTGVEAFYSAQILGTNLFTDGDLATLGFRYDDMSTAKRYVFDLNTRYPLGRKFRIAPRLRLARRDSRVIDQMQYTVRPSIRMNYLPSRLFQLELEAGGEWTRTDTLMDRETVRGYYIIGGYRLDF